MKDEQEEVDADVNFGATGQVKLIQECEDRTSISITARPQSSSDLAPLPPTFRVAGRGLISSGQVP